jgi:hypothetical protein
MRQLFVLGLLGLAVAGIAAAAPDLSGHWKLNTAKSHYGAFPEPSVMTRTISQDGISLSLNTVQKGSQGELTSELHYTTDGKVCTNKLASGEVKGTAHWEGDELVIESSQQIQGYELKSREVWTLSKDGNTLTIATHLYLPQQGAFDVQQVFEKQ